MVDLGTSSVEAATIELSRMMRQRQQREADVNSQARAYLSQQANYWRAQGDECYARECEAEMEKWQ